MVQKGATSVKPAMEKLEHFLELGGTKKDITLLVISGVALIVSIFDLVPCRSMPRGPRSFSAASPSF